MARKGKGKTQPIMLDIKMRYVGPAKPSREDVIAALEHMLVTGGDVPRYWQFAAIDWSRPKSGTQGYRMGNVANFAQFAPIIRAKIQNLKVAIDRRPEPPPNA